MRKILRVDVGAGTAVFEDLPPDPATYGGRALTSTIVAREVDAAADALGTDNKIVFAPGLLSGATAPSSSRLSVGCKSPPTDGIKEASSGGQASQRPARLGIAAIVVQGDPAGKKWLLPVERRSPPG